MPIQGYKMRLQTDLPTPKPIVADKLTERELEILLLSSEGFNHKEISVRLNLTEDTIDTHSRRINTKLGARNTKHAIATALRKKIIK